MACACLHTVFNRRIVFDLNELTRHCSVGNIKESVKMQALFFGRTLPDADVFPMLAVTHHFETPAQFSLERLLVVFASVVSERAEVIELLQIDLAGKAHPTANQIAELPLKLHIHIRFRTGVIVEVRKHGGEDCSFAVLAGQVGGLRVKLLEKVFARHSDGCRVLLVGLRFIVERKGERRGFGSEIHAPFLEYVVFRKIEFGSCFTYFFRFFADGFSRLRDGFACLLLPDFDKFLDGFTAVGRRTVGVRNCDIVTAVEIEFALAVNHTLCQVVRHKCVPTRPMRNALGQEGTGQSGGPRSRGLGAQMFNGGLVLFAIEHFCPVPVVPEFQIPPDKIASCQATSRPEFSLNRLRKRARRTQRRSE